MAVGHGGWHAVAAARAYDVRTLFTLSGAHIFPLYDAAVGGRDAVTRAEDPSTAGPLTELSTGPTAPGANHSCCFDGHSGLDGIFTGQIADMTHQVDHVFVTNTQGPNMGDPIVPDATAVSTKVVGQDTSVFNRFGMWPSDHSGLVTKIQFPTD